MHTWQEAQGLMPQFLAISSRSVHHLHPAAQPACRHTPSCLCLRCKAPGRAWDYACIQTCSPAAQAAQ